MSEMNVQKFHKALSKQGYLCTQEFADKVYCALNKKPMSITMLIGQAGTGKSFLPETLGDVLKCNVYVKQAYQGMDWDEFVRKHVPDENTKSGIKSIDAELLRAVQESQESKVILLLDEWDKTRISSDSYFLDFLQTGRISVSGQKYQANLDNLIIFFTSNNERDISEPLLRRVKVIEVEHLPVSLVANVLKKRYEKNSTGVKMIEPVLKLYHTSIGSDMDKPATIQELCDLINDWIVYTNQNRDPNWEELVYVNVTKSERNHLALQKAIKDDTDKRDKEVFDKSLDSDYFNVSVDIDDDEEVSTGVMPRMMKLRNINPNFECDSGESKDDVYVEIQRTDEAYTSAYIEAIDSNKEVSVPHFVGWNTIKNDVIQRSKPYPLSEILSEWSKFNRMINKDGAIVFYEQFVDRDDVLSFIEWSAGTVRKGDDDKIIFRIYGDGRYNGKTKKPEINGRWIRNEGCEVICDSRALPKLQSSVQESNWYANRKSYLDFGDMQQNIHDTVLSEKRYVQLRSLGHNKDYLNVIVKGELCYSDDLSYHLNLVRSGEARIKETSRTTTYDMGWAVVQSWHRKDKPNYKNHIIIKERPNSTDNMFSIKLVRGKLGTVNNKIPIFVNMDASQFDKCDRDLYEQTSSSRILRKRDDKNGLHTYAINAYDRTVFMIESGSKDNYDLAFDFADTLRNVRDKTLELIC